MIGEWLLRQIRKVEGRNHPQQGPLIMQQPNMLTGLPIISVYRISNGYILSSTSEQYSAPTLVYCKEVSEIGDQIITLQAREAMGIPNTVRITATGGGGGGGVSIPAKQAIPYPRS